MNSPPQLLYTDSTGRVDVLIAGKEYSYAIDAALLPPILRLWRRAPWRALNILKAKGRLVESP